VTGISCLRQVYTLVAYTTDFRTGFFGHPKICLEFDPEANRSTSSNQGTIEAVELVTSEEHTG
jgi:hypothetical protein